MSGKAYISHHHKIVAFWSPKCACTSVARWFLAIEELGEKVEGNKKRWLARNGYELSYPQALRLINDLHYKVVYFTRDPFSRAVSAFLNKFYIYSERPLVNYSELENFSKEFIRDINKSKGLPPEKFDGISFVDYLKRVKFLMDNNKPLNEHWDCQVPRNVVNLTKIDFKVAQENFKSDVEKVNKNLNLINHTPGKRNKTEYPDSYKETKENYANVNSLIAHEERIALSKLNLLSYESVELIKDIYQQDFTHLGYDKNYLL